tara:strand:- start:466 stop:1437 length:972 start_codon:yes stop_codon:yes gene_type:complete
MKKALWLKSINQEKIIKYRKLEGGVSSEVYHVTTDKNEYCIKRSLKKLLVKKKWFVDTNRINFEFFWLNHCRKILKRNIPKTYQFSNEKKYIVMEYLDTVKYKTLKELYFNKIINLKTIKLISKHLYKIHTNSNNVKIKNIFKHNNKNFIDLRLDPYFNEVGRVYPKYKDYIKYLNKSYLINSSTLVHGDFSPKNILIGKNKIVYLDAECCNFGDPVFDLVFFSNHLLIKSIFIADKSKQFIKSYMTFYNEYLSNLNTKNYKMYIDRIIQMTPIMLLARIDGKSPVEYIRSKKIKNTIRKKSFLLLDSKLNSLNDIVRIINER